MDYGVRRRSTATPGKPQKRGEVLPEEEKFLKGVRICRECRPVLLYVPVAISVWGSCSLWMQTTTVPARDGDRTVILQAV